ncbi:MAG: Na/Pi symporter [Saprospiraceae bacterium]
MTIIDFWRLLAGLGLFLYGMFHLEDAMKQLDGRRFKLFLKKHTKKKLSAIFSGTIITGILQSSSIVNLMVLSFVGAGMLSMRNALGVALGANVGGTFNSWLVALLGFKVDIGQYALPVIGIAGIGLIVFKGKKYLYQVSKFCMGFGLLFLGLDFMKNSMNSSIKQFDFTPYLGYNLIIFVLIGFVITALIQTSAATIVIVLSALYAKIIPIETAVAVVLGAELGTTIKILLGSIGGIAAKKRVAVGNIIFNIVSSLFGFILLVPIVRLLKDFIGIVDPVIILVAFQTLINIAGAILFYYLLNYLSDFLEKRFVDNEKTATSFLQNTSPENFSIAIDMLEKEVGLFIFRVIHLNMEVFQLEAGDKSENDFEKYAKRNNLFSDSLEYNEKYNMIKQAEGEILSFYSKMGSEEISAEHVIHLNQLMASIRNAMYAAKGMKDINHDRIEFSNSANELKYDIYKLFQSKLNNFYSNVNEVFLSEDKPTIFEKLEKLLAKIDFDYQQIMNNSYSDISKNILKEIDISTLFNVNRELYSSCKSIIFSLKDYLLSATDAENFENITLSVSK